MKLLSESAMSKTGETVLQVKGAAPADYLKVYASGELAANGGDRRFYLRINGIDSGYQSFILMNGHGSVGEWDGLGYYVGRNAWGIDADYSIEFTIAAASMSNMRTGFGLSTFGHANRNILGYEAHGFLVSNQPITIESVSLFVTPGGVVTGKMKVFAI